MKSLSRYLSHALVLSVTLAVGAYVAPTAFSTHPQASFLAQALASDSNVRPSVRLVGAASGCAAPPAISNHASLRQLTGLLASVQTAISGCAARVEQVNRQQAELDAQIAALEQRLAVERPILAALARSLYSQPQSVLVALTSSRSLGDFFTRYSDLQSASARAQSLTEDLNREQARLASDRASVAESIRELAQARAALNQASARLQQLEYAALERYPAAAPAIFVPKGPADVIADIERAFAPLGSGAVSWGLRVAKCESNYNPNAVNSWSGTEGLFQFMPSTWRSTPYGHQNVFDPWYNSLGAAWLYQRDGPGQWQCG